MNQVSSTAQFQLTTQAIKWIAIISMLCDHFAKIVLRAMINHHWTDASVILALHSDGVLSLYNGLQYFGRLAFPLFVFLLVEGFFLTRNRWKYLRRIFIFALISEIPFDLGFRMESIQVSPAKIVEFSYQNVMFTLVIGLLAMILIDQVMKKFGADSQGAVLAALIGVGAVLLGNLMKTDYRAYGVAAIMIAFWIRQLAPIRAKTKSQQTGWRMLEMALLIAPLILQSHTEVWALIDVGLIAFYFGKRGKQYSKWFFYVFYPAHLAALVVIRTLIVSVS